MQKPKLAGDCKCPLRIFLTSLPLTNPIVVVYFCQIKSHSSPVYGLSDRKCYMPLVDGMGQECGWAHRHCSYDLDGIQSKYFAISFLINLIIVVGFKGPICRFFLKAYLKFSVLHLYCVVPSHQKQLTSSLQAEQYFSFSSKSCFIYRVGELVQYERHKYGSSDSHKQFWPFIWWFRVRGRRPCFYNIFVSVSATLPIQLLAQI